MAFEPINDQEKHDKVDAIVASLEGVDIQSKEALTAYQQIIEQYTPAYEHTSTVRAFRQAITRVQGSDPHELIDFTRQLACNLWTFARDDGDYPAVLGTPVYR